MRILWEGARGPAVKALQTRLKEHGFDPGDIDGVFGPQTTAAVVAFQKKRNAYPDGIAGAQTFNALNLRIHEREPPASERTKVFVSSHLRRRSHGGSAPAHPTAAASGASFLRRRGQARDRSIAWSLNCEWSDHYDEAPRSPPRMVDRHGEAPGTRRTMEPRAEPRFWHILCAPSTASHRAGRFSHRFQTMLHPFPCNFQAMSLGAPGVVPTSTPARSVQ